MTILKIIRTGLSQSVTEITHSTQAGFLSCDVNIRDAEADKGAVG